MLAFFFFPPLFFFFSSIRKRKVIIFWPLWNVLKLPHPSQLFCTIISAALVEATEQRQRLNLSFISANCHSRRGPRHLGVPYKGNMALQLPGCICLRHSRDYQLNFLGHWTYMAHINIWKQTNSLLYIVRLPRGFYTSQLLCSTEHLWPCTI